MFLRASLLMVLVASWGLPAQAQMPEPYGAWRGKIRYTEGPFRTRTHVRWGGGITPVGGQVLMHLGTVAGNVATDPNFWSGVGGLPGAERDAEPNPVLTGTIADIQAANLKLLADLNAIRNQFSLPPLEFAPVAAAPPAGEATAVIPHGAPGSLTQRLTEWLAAADSIDAAVKAIGTQLAIAKAIADDPDVGPMLDQAAVMRARQAAASPLFSGAQPGGTLNASPLQFEQTYAAAQGDLAKLLSDLQAAIGTGMQLRQGAPQLFSDRPARQALLDDLQKTLAEARQIQL